MAKPQKREDLRLTFCLDWENSVFLFLGFFTPKLTTPLTNGNRVNCGPLKDKREEKFYNVELPEGQFFRSEKKKKKSFTHLSLSTTSFGLLISIT